MRPEKGMKDLWHREADRLEELKKSALPAAETRTAVEAVLALDGLEVIPDQLPELPGILDPFQEADLLAAILGTMGTVEGLLPAGFLEPHLLFSLDSRSAETAPVPAETAADV